MITNSFELAMQALAKRGNLLLEQDRPFYSKVACPAVGPNIPFELEFFSSQGKSNTTNVDQPGNLTNSGHFALHVLQVTISKFDTNAFSINDLEFVSNLANSMFVTINRNQTVEGQFNGETFQLVTPNGAGATGNFENEFIARGEYRFNTPILFERGNPFTIKGAFEAQDIGVEDFSIGMVMFGKLITEQTAQSAPITMQ